MKLFNSAATRMPTRLYSLWAVLLLAFAQCSWAFTPSGVAITNQASVDYVVSTSPIFTVTSNLVEFKVDKKIDLLVTQTTAAATAVNAGQIDAITSFIVTNLGNDAQDFSLVAAVATGDPAVGGVAPFTANDFNATNLRVFVDNPGAGGTVGVYDAAFDTATFLPNLAAGATSPTLFIVGDIPSSLTGQQSVVSLTATVIPLAGNPALQSPADALITVDDPAVVNVVYADTAGVIDAARDGQHSAYGGYLAGAVAQVSKSIVSVQPTSGAPLFNPVASPVLNPTSGDPALRPDSILTYRIVTSFAGTGTISNLTLSDPVPAETRYVANSITVDGVAKTDAADGDNVQVTGNVITVARGSVTTSVASPAANVIIQFKATIN